MIRIYHKNNDIETEWFDDLQTALLKIGKEEKDICSKTNWMNYTDLSFMDTPDFIRVKN